MDPNFTDLIHGEIDGTNSPVESEKLRDHLARDRAAFDLYTDLTRLAGVLRKIQPVEPPADLRPALVSAIRERSDVRRAAPRQGVPTAHVWRYGAAVAAGVALGFFGAQLVGNLATVDPGSSISGTMAPRREAAAELIRVEGPKVTGTIQVDSSPSRVAVRVDLGAADPVAVNLDFDGAELDLTSFTRTEGEGVTVDATERGLALSGTGNQSYGLVLERRDTTAGRLIIRITSSGAPVQEHVIPLLGPG